jgi:hypothetical protein
MNKVVAYLAGIPAGPKNSHKRDILTSFIAGVNVHNDNGIAYQGLICKPASLAVIQGWVHEQSSMSPHLLLRSNVVDFQKKNNNSVLVVDSNLFNYLATPASKKYFRFSLGGVFPPTGNYMWDTIDPNRWPHLSKMLGVQLKEWRSQGDHILICTQRDKGWSMKSTSVVTWLEETILTIRKFSNRPIIVRPHPGDKLARTYLSTTGTSYKLSTSPLISEDFRNAHAVVTYNSSPGVAAVIEGIPCFVTDPQPQYSQAFTVANVDLSLIETPTLPDRLSWISQLAMCHWSLSELEQGIAWAHIRNYIAQ